jgi:hypothetical protein
MLASCAADNQRIATMQRLTWGLAACLAVFALAGLAGPARADVIYTNLGPGESCDGRAGFPEIGPNTGNPPVRQAMAFTVGGTDTFFDSARFALSLDGGANEIDLRLYNTVGGQPGTVLDTMHVSGQMPRFGMYGSGHLVTLDSAIHPLLQAGATYWLLPFASGDTFAVWNDNTQGGIGLYAYSSEVEPTTWVDVHQWDQGAFEVNGTPSPAPEPSGLALAGVGLFGLLGCVWRRRKPAVA